MRTRLMIDRGAANYEREQLLPKLGVVEQLNLPGIEANLSYFVQLALIFTLLDCDIVNFAVTEVAAKGFARTSIPIHTATAVTPARHRKTRDSQARIERCRAGLRDQAIQDRLLAVPVRNP